MFLGGFSGLKKKNYLWNSFLWTNKT
jgi:hypothetical protein